MSDKIYNNYGAALTAEEFADNHRDDKSFKRACGSILAMRFYIQSYGFNRVSRKFADEVISAGV